MTTLFLWKIFSSILWIQIMCLIFCDLLRITKSCTVDSAKDVAVYRPNEKVNPKSRKFSSCNTKAINLQSCLHYKEKPYWPMQWIMNEDSFIVLKKWYSPSMNIAEMHKRGIKGKDVGVVIIGNSRVNCLHEEIKSRCHAEDTESTLSKHIKQYTPEELKVCLSDDTIPSEVAGIIGMSDNSKRGGVGIAPQCTIGSIDVSSGRRAAPEYNADIIISRNTSPSAEVFIHAWINPTYDLTSVLEAQFSLNRLNLRNESKKRKAHVMGSGRFGIYANSCQCNQYASADSMFVFGSIGYNGYVLPFSETCASLIGVTYSPSDGESFYNNIITISSSEPDSFVFASKNDPSSSAAVAGGVIALIVNAFKNKFGISPTISDLAFLLAFSSKSDTLQDKNMLWFSNGIGLMYSQQAGFGLPNMLNVLEHLETWTPMQFPDIYEPKTEEMDFSCFRDDSKSSLTYVNNMICDIKIDNKQGDYYIQLVSVELSAELKKRGSFSIYLISPTGTISCILEGRPFDMTRTGYENIILRSNHFLGETLNGNWSIRFYVYKAWLQGEHSPNTSSINWLELKKKSDYYSRLTEVKMVANYRGPILLMSEVKLYLDEYSDPDLSLMATELTEERISDVEEPLNDDGDHNAASNSFSNVELVAREFVNPSEDGKSNDLSDNKNKHVRFSDKVEIIVDGPNNPKQAEGTENARDSTELRRPPNLRRVSSFPNYEKAAPVRKKINIVKVKRLKFRFVLHKRLPSTLKSGPIKKNQLEITKNFELLKAWVDFRHYLLAKFDPSSDDYLELNEEELIELLNRHVTQLIAIQKNVNIDSIFKLTPDHTAANIADNNL